jgi:hypothetical protein
MIWLGALRSRESKVQNDETVMTLPVSWKALLLRFFVESVFLWEGSPATFWTSIPPVQKVTVQFLRHVRGIQQSMHNKLALRVCLNGGQRPGRRMRLGSGYLVCIGQIECPCSTFLPPEKILS